jgi:hypothetical protein
MAKDMHTADAHCPSGPLSCWLSHNSEEGATMTDPNERQPEHDGPDELELDAETVKDLEADSQGAEAVRGGICTLGSCGAATGPCPGLTDQR